MTERGVDATPSDLVERVLALRQSVCPTIGHISAESPVEALLDGLDSIGLLEFLVALEDRCGIAVDWVNPHAPLGDPRSSVSSALASSLTSRLMPPTGPEPFRGHDEPAVHGAARTRSALDGPAVRLRPVHDVDVPWLRSILLGEDSWRWRTRGEIPSPHHFSNLLETATLAHVIVETADGENGVGYLCTHSVDPRDQVASIAGLIVPEFRSSPLSAAAFSQFITYLFEEFPLRKLYMEVPEFNLQPGLSTTFLALEGRLTEHTFAKGRWWDVLILAVTREAWMERMSGGALSS